MKHGLPSPIAHRAAWLVLAALLVLPTARAQQAVFEDPAAVVAVAQSFLADTLNERAQAIGGTLHLNVAAPDARQHLTACSQMQAYLPPGARTSGRTLVGVRCLAPRAWQAFLAVDIHLEAPVWVAARALPQGHAIAPADIMARTLEVTLDGANARLVPAVDGQVIGQTLVRGLAADSPLRSSDLLESGHLNPGDAVEVVAVGSGFRVSGEGRTIGSANPGQNVQVRMTSGLVVTGILSDAHVVELHL
jgi:flagella basal body P-ring formation protein FlgA